MEVRMPIPNDRDEVLALINQLKSKEIGTARMSYITLPEAFKQYRKAKDALTPYYGLPINVSSAKAFVKAFDAYEEARSVYQHVQDRYVKLRQKLKELKVVKDAVDDAPFWVDLGKTVKVTEGASRLLLDSGGYPDVVSRRLSKCWAPYLEAGISVKMGLFDGKPLMMFTFAEVQERALDIHKVRSLLLTSILRKKLVDTSLLDEFSR